MRVAGLTDDEADYLAYTDYAVLKLSEYTDPKTGRKHAEVSAWASDGEEKSYPGCIYMYNRGRTLDEAIWILGGEHDGKEAGDGTP